VFRRYAGSARGPDSDLRPSHRLDLRERRIGVQAEVVAGRSRSGPATPPGTLADVLGDDVGPVGDRNLVRRRSADRHDRGARAADRPPDTRRGRPGRATRGARSCPGAYRTVPGEGHRLNVAFRYGAGSSRSWSAPSRSSASLSRWCPMATRNRASVPSFRGVALPCATTSARASRSARRASDSLIAHLPCRSAIDCRSFSLPAVRMRWAGPNGPTPGG
jgi:hypothetical protein